MTTLTKPLRRAVNCTPVHLPLAPIRKLVVTILPNGTLRIHRFRERLPNPVNYKLADLYSRGLGNLFPT